MLPEKAVGSWIQRQSDLSQYMMHKLGGPIIALGPKLTRISHIGRDDHNCNPCLKSTSGTLHEISWVVFSTIQD